MPALAQETLASGRFAPARALWRTLITHVQPESDASPRLKVAADLARRLDAFLIGVGAEMLQPIGMGDPYGMLGGDFIQAMETSLKSNLDTAASRFRERTSGIRSQWCSVQDQPVGALCRLARGADLIVAGGSPLDARDSYRWCDPAALAIGSGRPVLVAPPAGERLEARAALVAWKDTREARRALADALPILKCADDVLVLAACSKDDVRDMPPHTDSVVQFLQRHGITAHAKVNVAAVDEVVELIQAEAEKMHADLIVAGAYGHSRVGEWIFGGVTRDLLLDPQRFLFLSH